MQYERELAIREATNSRILAKIKFSRTFPNLQYCKSVFAYFQNIEEMINEKTINKTEPAHGFLSMAKV